MTNIWSSHSTFKNLFSFDSFCKTDSFSSFDRQVDRICKVKGCRLACDFFFMLKFRGLVVSSKDEKWLKAKLSNIAIDIQLM